MAVALTIEQANEYLAEIGLSLPSFVVQALINKGASMDACLDGAGYTDDDALLIKLYLFGMMAVTGGARRVKSQSAPSGASRSFDYGVSQFREMRSMLAALDSSGCSAALQPSEPLSKAGLWVSPIHKAQS